MNANIQRIVDNLSEGRCTVESVGIAKRHAEDELAQVVESISNRKAGLQFTCAEFEELDARAEKKLRQRINDLTAALALKR